MSLIFIYEHLNAAGGGLPASLRREGQAMLSALVDDFLAVPGIEVQCLLDAESPRQLGSFCHRVAIAEEPHRFRELAARSDGVIVIAPETGGILEERSRWVLEVGGRLLSSTPEAIRLAGDKARLAEHFAKCGIPTPALTNDPIRFPLVLKPRDGAGSQATFLVVRVEDLDSAWEQAQSEATGSEFVMQDYISGRPASMAILRGPQQTLFLPACSQWLSEDGRFHYRGGSLPMPDADENRVRRLVELANASMNGLQGFAGFDIVLADDPIRDAVIEINPRLTTSYLGLRAACGVNLAQAWMDVTEGREVRLPASIVPQTWSVASFD